jgi:hypothetical protein
MHLIIIVTFFGGKAAPGYVLANVIKSPIHFPKNFLKIIILKIF